MFQHICRLFVLLIVAGCAAPQIAPSRSADRNSFEGVVARLAPIVTERCLLEGRVKRCDFRLLVVRSKTGEANAFQTKTRQGQPYVIITTDLIDALKNADELALVLAHEAAHHILNHLDQQAVFSRIGAEIFAEAAKEQGLSGREQRQAIQIATFLGRRHFSKAFELEADALGAVLSKQAGYNPVRASAYYQRLPDPEGGAFGTHPENALRRATVLAAVQ